MYGWSDAPHQTSTVGNSAAATLFAIDPAIRAVTSFGLKHFMKAVVALSSKGAVWKLDKQHLMPSTPLG